MLKDSSDNTSSGRKVDEDPCVERHRIVGNLRTRDPGRATVTDGRWTGDPLLHGSAELVSSRRRATAAAVTGTDSCAPRALAKSDIGVQRSVSTPA